MFELIGHSVLKLRRVRIGFLTDEGMKPGHWRYLSAGEVARMMKPPGTAAKGKRT
jgi:16S rRNA U516 pseudouridylate synthase RsuA-like enzyme